jgi:hypothetical protein
MPRRGFAIKAAAALGSLLVEKRNVFSLGFDACDSDSL